MSSFFLPSKRGKGRKRQSTATKKARTPKRARDEDIGSDSDVASDDATTTTALAAAESDEETAQEKRLRLTKELLDQLEKEERDKAEDEEATRDLLGDRLKDDVLEQKGKLQRKLALQYEKPDPAHFKWLRGHRLSVTCLVVTPDDKFLYTGSKDSSIIKWNLDTFKKESVVTSFSRKVKKTKQSRRHEGHILCLAMSSDGKFLASGARDNLVLVWDVETDAWLHTFQGHRDAVSGLAFRMASHQLFSCSHDRTVKIWNLDEMAYVETLFGHQDAVTGIDSLLRERAVTCGNDRTVRVWKVVEESQLVFHGHKASIDCIKQINEDHFISGSQDGSIALWNLTKKKPAVLVPNAHGVSPYYSHQNKDTTTTTTTEPVNGTISMFRALTGSKDQATGSCEETAFREDAVKNKEAWITSVSAIPNSDLVVSAGLAGSSDARLRFWICGEKFKSLTELFTVPMTGFVNSMAFSHKGNFLALGIGQEHKLGRWWRQKEAKNGICIVPLTKCTATMH